MMGFLSDPAWLGVIVGVLAIIAPLAVSVMLYLKSRSLKELSVQLIFNLPLYQYNEVLKYIGVGFTLDGKLINHIRFVTVKIWNSGNTQILPEDFVTPVRIDFGNDAQISTAYLQTKPEYLIDEFHFSVEGNKLVMEPMLLNRNYEIILGVVINNFEGKVEAEGLIKGVDTIRKKTNGERYKQVSTKEMLFVVWANVIAATLCASVAFAGIASHSMLLKNPDVFNVFFVLIGILSVYIIILSYSLILFIELYKERNRFLKKHDEEFMQGVFKFIELKQTKDSDSKA